MSYTVINVLTVPEGSGEALEQRFSGRAGTVDSAPGFEHFELLRPVEGTDTYLVYTRWQSKADYEAWTASRAFDEGHGRGRGHGHPGGEAARPAATGSQLWAFEVVQSSTAS